jgi:hypothetical protein
MWQASKTMAGVFGKSRDGILKAAGRKLLLYSPHLSCQGGMLELQRCAGPANLWICFRQRALFCKISAAGATSK